MGMGHIERGVDASIDISDLLKILSPEANEAYKVMWQFIEESGSTFGGQDLLPNSNDDIRNLLTDYVAMDLDDEAYEAYIKEKAEIIKNFADIVEKETGLVIGLTYADGTNGDRYDDVGDVWVWFGCNIKETVVTAVGRRLAQKGVRSQPLRWSDYG
jgi:hypothetical protein